MEVAISLITVAMLFFCMLLPKAKEKSPEQKVIDAIKEMTKKKPE
jgi:preprotein translocase subunit YajC